MGITRNLSGRRQMSRKTTPYSRPRHGSGSVSGAGGTGISTSAKSLPQPTIPPLLIEEDILEDLPMASSSSPARVGRLQARYNRPPMAKAVSLDYDDSHHTYCSTSSKQTTIRIENTADNTSVDEDTDDDDLMVSAESDRTLPKLRTVSTVSECSEFSTAN